MTGFRYYLENEFTSIYIFNLRGNQRTSGELSRQEGGKIFGSGSRTPISISLLVKNPSQKKVKSTIHYYDIGDYLSREKKLEIINKFSTVSNIKWIILSPNKHNDWLSQRNDVYSTFISIGDKENKLQNTFFTTNYSLGIATGRDHFCWNYSSKLLKKKIKETIEFYNAQCTSFKIAKNKESKISIDDFVEYDHTKISWNANFKQDIERGIKYNFISENVFHGIYRPFCKQNVYFSNELNARQYQMTKIFPKRVYENIIICVSGLGSTKENSVYLSNTVTDLNCLSAGTQCFPLYWYEKKEKIQGSLFDKTDEEYTRHNAISDFILEQAKTRYGPKVIKEDIFYYVYGLLHSPDYRKTFANDLKKILPRLPLVEKVADFWAFSKAGRSLANIHLNYEKQEPPKEVLINDKPIPKKLIPENQLIVNKMSFPSKGQKDTIVYNSYLTISNIPEKAYEYIVNGKSAIEWVMERYAVTTHKESGIKNDPNDWAKEHENPQYILDLLLSVITVSVKTVEIVEGLPKVEWA